jgi:hypothetical protein
MKFTPKLHMLQTPSKRITGRRSAAEKYFDPVEVLPVAQPEVEGAGAACFLPVCTSCSSTKAASAADLALRACTSAKFISMRPTQHKRKHKSGASTEWEFRKGSVFFC